MPNNTPPPDHQADGSDQAELEAEVSNPSSANTASLEDDVTLPDEITGQADATDEDLTSLFRNASKRHFADGFHGGSGDDAAGTISAAEIPDDMGNRPELE